MPVVVMPTTGIFHFGVAQGSLGRNRKRARHPRGRNKWPFVGIFGQRGKGRPNRIGLSRCTIVKVEGTVLTVRALDAIDGTPVLDIKPYMREFDPIGTVR